MMRGFTIIEVIVVLGILGILLVATAPVAWEFYQGIDLKSEYQNYKSYLNLARAYAMANKNASAHGVFFDNYGATIFQGTSFASRDATRDQSFPKSPLTTVSGATEINFAALSGKTSAASIMLSNSRGSLTININIHGKIE